MATVRDRVLELHGKGYTPAEIKKELHSDGVRSITKTYIAQCLAIKAGESQHQRRTELIYEMCLEILARLEILTGKLERSQVRKVMDRLETFRHPPMDVHTPPTEPSGSG